MTIPKLCPLAEVLGINQDDTDEKSIAHYIGDCACNYSICKFNSNGKICRINDTHRLVSDTNVMLRHLYERLDLVDID
jgi:acetone carboxylase gamma subunit